MMAGYDCNSYLQLSSRSGNGCWSRSIESRYGHWRDMRSSLASRKNSYSWNDLGSVCDVNTKYNWFDRRIRWKYDNNSMIKF